MLKSFLLLLLMITTFKSFSAVPTEALTFDTNIGLLNATSARETKARAAEEFIKNVIRSDAFRTAVLNHTYNGVKTFVDNEGLSNEQIYMKIIEGAEELNKVKNYRLDMDVEFYYENSNTVGYTNSGTNKIYSNTKYFDTYDAKGVSNNFTHEWLHKLGFSHAYYYSTSRDYSVPYAVGDIVEKIARSGNFDSTPETPSTAPTNLTLAVSGTSLTLKWAAASGAVQYKVYRRLSGSTTNYLQGTVTALSFTQTAPSSDAVYYVRAVDANGNTVKSAEVTYKKTAILTPVTSLTLYKTSSGVALSWKAGTSVNGIKYYKIYRRLAGSTTNYLQGTTTSLYFYQTQPTSNAVYYVRSVDNNDVTVKSAEVSFTK